MLFENIFRGLDSRGIRYVIVGGIAVNLHGFARATGDLDLILSLAPKSVQGFVDLIKSLGWKPKIPEPLESFADSKRRDAWMREKGMKVFSVYNPKHEIEHLDVLLDYPGQFADFYRRRKTMSSGGLRLPVMSIPDLIQLKVAAGRERDRIDIEALKEIQRIQRAKKRSQKG